MNLKSAQKFVNEQLDKDFTIKGQKINLSEKNWSFGGFDKAKKRAGVCRFTQNILVYQKH